MDKDQLSQLKPIDESLTMFLLGATGDLARKKILKAVFELFKQRLLPKEFRMIAVGRTEMSDLDYREMVEQVVGVEDAGELKDFLGRIRYLSGDLNEFSTFERIKLMHQDQASSFGCGNHLWYMATLPSLYVAVARYIGQAGLNQSKCGWTKLLIEKPFGTDVETAGQLNQFLTSVFKEDQIYRIDHFLAKETVQNLLSFRFGNGIFENLWDRRFVDSIQVMSTETVGLVGRGEFFEGVGTVRDVVQNHVLQMIAMTMMEEPSSLAAKAIHKSRNELLAATRVWQNDVSRWVKFGQYRSYVKEAGLEVTASATETAVAAVLEVDNERWRGVPIFVRAGKRMQQTVTEISVQFKEPPNKLFGAVGQTGNVLTLRIQPNEGVILRLNAKRPGLKLEAEAVPMQFCYKHAFQMGLVEAYVKLIYDAISGNSQLFPDSEGIEKAWKVVEPLLQFRRQPDLELPSYEEGSWGPESFEKLITETGRLWLEPSMVACAI